MNAKKMTLFSLTIPILLEQILRSLMGTVNTFMLSRLSDDAAAAVGVANQILSVVNMGASMLTTGAVVLVNQAIGGRRDRDAAVITMNSLLAAEALGLFMSAFTFTFAGGVISAMGLTGDLVGYATQYLRIVGASCALQFLSSMLTAHFRCRGKANVSTFVVALINTVNFIGSWLVVNNRFFLGGVAGIATARLIAEAIGLVALLLLFRREQWGLRLWDLLHPSAMWLKRIARIGFMSGMEGISYLTAQLLTIRFITGFPTASLSAKIYTQSINGYTYMVGHAIGLAAQILCGQLIGAGRIDEADRLMKRSWACVLGFNMAFSLLFYAFSNQLVGLFTQSVEIRAIARTLFMIDIATCAGRSMNHSFNLGLYSAGYAFWPMVVSIASIWLVQVGCGYLLTVPAGLGVVGLWLGQALDEWTRGLAVTRLWLRKKWVHNARAAARQ